MAQLDGLTTAIETYFAAIHECDVAKLDAVFHPQSSLFDADNGEVFVEPIESFRADVAGRPSPHSAGQALEAERDISKVWSLRPAYFLTPRYQHPFFDEFRNFVKNFEISHQTAPQT